jgi:hypothetical protein
MVDKEPQKLETIYCHGEAASFPANEFERINGQLVHIHNVTTPHWIRGYAIKEIGKEPGLAQKIKEGEVK